MTDREYRGVNHFTENCFRMVDIVSKNTFFNSDRLPLFYYDLLTCVLLTRKDKAASVQRISCYGHNKVNCSCA